MSLAVATPELASIGFLERVSSTIGPEITPERVDRVLQGSEDRNLIFHGIKSRTGSRRAFRDGVLPLTPEGGKASWWAYGQHLFSHPEDQGFFGFDSPFFHYSHWRDESFGVSGMTLAVTSREGMEGYVDHGGQAQVIVRVPADEILFLNVETVTDNPNGVTGQAKQLRMFELLEEAVERGPMFGMVVHSFARV